MLVGETPLFQTTVERIDALAEGVKRITLRSHDGTPLPSWSLALTLTSAFLAV